MPKKILFEAHALTLKTGTGIATYARNLAKTASGAGYDAELLLGIDRPINRRDPLLAEIALYDANKPPSFNPMTSVTRAIDWTIGVPMGSAGATPAAAACRAGPDVGIDPGSASADASSGPARGARVPPFQSPGSTDGDPDRQSA